jgi:hypothetical protein
MRQLRQSVFFLVIGLVVFLNLERFDIGEANLINIHSFVYVLGSGGVLATILIPALSQIRFPTFLGIWLGTYLLLKVFIFNDRPMIGGAFTYLFVTEMALLTALAWLAYRVAEGLQEFVEAVKVVTLAGMDKSIPEVNEEKDLIHAEMNRVRRYGRPLSVIVATMDARSAQVSLPRLIQETQRLLSNRFVNARLASIVRAELRRMDIILGDYERGRVIAICPEVNNQGISQLIERIRGAVQEELEISVKCGGASFPDGALTFEDLVLQAEEHANHPNSEPQMLSASSINFSGVTNSQGVDGK